jgi:xanthine dehydrogenase iron-sulfur cluster and FAD-binding subunit A
VNSCLVLAVMKDGADVTTVEGLAGTDLVPALGMALVHHADRRAQLPRRAVAALKGVARFDYVRAGTVAEAIQAFQADPKARFIAGGTNLVAPQRQMLPLIASRISSRLLAWPSFIMPTDEHSCPGASAQAP